MNNILHRLIATMPSFFALFVPDGGLAALLLFSATFVLGAYHGFSAESELYDGALSDIKTMWLIHLVGIMLVTICFNL